MIRKGRKRNKYQNWGKGEMQKQSRKEIKGKIRRKVREERGQKAEKKIKIRWMRRRNVRRTRKRSHSPWLLHAVNRLHSKERLRCWQRIAPLWHSICIIMGTNRTGWLKEHAVDVTEYPLALSNCPAELTGVESLVAVSENYTADWCS